MILVVDDHVDLATALRRLLSHEGYQVHVEECGVDALEWLRSNQPRLVLLDHMMPDMDGAEVARRAIEEKLLVPPQVLFYTAAPKEVAPAVAALGLAGCISKGTDWNALRLRVAEQIVQLSLLPEASPRSADN